MLQFAKKQPSEQQMDMLAMGIEQFGSKFLRINGAQASLIAKFLKNQDNLSELENVSEDALKEFQTAFVDAGAQEAPLRVICKHCNTMNSI